MRNFTIILFIFFAVFLAFSLFVSDSLLLFLLIFLAFFASLICLFEYLGIWRGILSALCFILLPFLLEYLLYLLKIPYFQTPLIKLLTLKSLAIPITVNNLFLIFTIPLLFICSLIFAQKMRLFFFIGKYSKVFLIIMPSLLLSLYFLAFAQSSISYANFSKWLFISLLINIMASRFFKFNPQALDFYKEIPIIIYLAIYGANAAKRLDTFSFFIAIFLILIYLLLLYNEFKLKKINQQFSA